MLLSSFIIPNNRRCKTNANFTLTGGDFQLYSTIACAAHEWLQSDQIRNPAGNRDVKTLILMSYPESLQTDRTSLSHAYQPVMRSQVVH